MLNKIKEGSNLLEKAWEQFVKGGGVEYTNGDWKASYYSLGSPPLKGARVNLSGYGMLFMFPRTQISEQLMPPATEMVFMTDIEKQKTFWDLILLPRLQLWIGSSSIEINNREDISDEEKDILARGLGSFPKKNFWENEKLQNILRKSSIHLSDTEKQIQILSEKFFYKVNDLIDAALIDPKEFIGKGGIYPIIYFENEPKERVLAQMCVWAYRQCLTESRFEPSLLAEIKKTFNWMPVLRVEQETEIIEFLNSYIRNKIKRNHREFDYDITEKILKNWKVPPSRFSFDVFIKKTASDLYNREKAKQKDLPKEIYNNKSTVDDIYSYSDGINRAFLDETDYSEDISKGSSKPRSKKTGIFEGKKIKKEVDYPISVMVAASIIGCSTRWLYKKIEVGTIKNVGGIQRKLLSEGVCSRKKVCMLNRESVDQAKALYEDWVKGQENKEKKLIDYIVEEKGITPRGARKRIKENKDRGKTLEELILKVRDEVKRSRKTENESPLL